MRHAPRSRGIVATGVATPLEIGSVGLEMSNEANARRTELRFLIVGTPRSGTTLVQRLLSDVPEICVPVETHFFSQFVPSVQQQGLEFPIPSEHLEPLLSEHARLRVPSLDVAHVIEDLENTVASPWQLFERIVVALTWDAEIIGEKTPAHLNWWLPISENLPTLKFIWLLRDPRAVVASIQQVPWNDDSAAVLASRWAADVSCGLEMSRNLGPDRCFTVRFEQLVAQPERVVGELLSFLEVSPPSTYRIGADRRESEDSATELFDSAEWWKARATENPDSERASAWRQEIDEHDVALIDLICGRAMRRVGYRASRHPLGERLRALATAASAFRPLARGMWKRTVLRRQIRRFGQSGTKAKRT